MSAKEKPHSTPRRKFLARPWVRLLGAGGVVLVCALVWSIGMAQRTRSSAEARLVGRWQRPDGGYVIEIRGVDRRGRLAASYFNPNPVHVQQAEWKVDRGTLRVFVELRDRHYPSATYRLSYVPETETLTGEYHQPLVGETFDVEFARMP